MGIVINLVDTDTQPSEVFQLEKLLMKFYIFLFILFEVNILFWSNIFRM